MDIYLCMHTCIDLNFNISASIKNVTQIDFAIRNNMVYATHNEFCELLAMESMEFKIDFTIECMK